MQRIGGEGRGQPAERSRAEVQEAPTADEKGVQQG